MEFAEAKERLKSSWAVDRDDFARVKEQLKKKNAEHHIQNGRLSQSLKVCRPLEYPACLESCMSLQISSTIGWMLTVVRRRTCP